MDPTVADTISKYGEPNKYLLYGTAGFRDKHNLPLDYVFVRMGVLAYLRTVSLTGKSVGAVITASHNDEIDNGIKLVDVDGGMLSRQWEPLAVELANCKVGDFVAVCNRIILDLSLNMTSNNSTSVVLIGRDTRPHSAGFHACMKEGVERMGGRCEDLGEVITPMLHFTVRDMNQQGYQSSPKHPFRASEWTERYFHALTSGYKQLLKTTTHHLEANSRIVVDASFGVGSITLDAFYAHYISAQDSDEAAPSLSIDVRNAARTGKVNEDCGAEHAQKLQQPPMGVSAETDLNKLMCSFDGDGDRIVFHAFIPDSAGAPKWVLLDGDKIAALVSLLVHQELRASGLLDADQFTCGVVQTAYANGASTQFIRALGMPIHMAKTGVKYLHHKAQEMDVGIYFEANGHGTVVFSDRFVQAVHAYAPQSARSADGSSRRDVAFARLQATIKLINPAVGDALSDMLYCMAALQVLDMDLLSWHHLYTDLPSKQVKVSVPDKSLVSCSEDETAVTRPAALQADLETAMKSVTHGRCFVRPSGTEDVVRIYAEAATQEEANLLTQLTEQAIRKHLG